MQDIPSTSARSWSSSPAPFNVADAAEGGDDPRHDEPLASGQRKRYLASLGAGTPKV
jgi:hypothetical protein